MWTLRNVRALVLLATIGLTACAAVQHQTHVVVEHQLRAKQPQAALKTLEQQPVSAKQSALYYLNKAMVLRQLDNYQASIETFEQAKNVIGRLSPTSITGSLAAYTITEQFNNYQASTFDRLFVHIYQIMNYLALNKLDSARVEAMQIDLALNRLTEENLYQEAASARYITGLVFEANQEPDNAFIAYQHAFNNYQRANVHIPHDLQHRLKSLSHRLGVDLGLTLSESFVAQEEETMPPSLPHGQIVVLADIDFAPRLTMVDTTVVNPDNGNIVRVSIPKYQSRMLERMDVRLSLKPKRIATANTTVENTAPASTVTESADAESTDPESTDPESSAPKNTSPEITAPEITASGITAQEKNIAAEDLANIEAIAMEELDRKMPTIIARTISRNISKNAIANQVSEENQILGQLVSIVGAALEQADTRSWLTLPNKLQIASQSLAQGNYQLQVEVLDRSGHVVHQKTIDSIEVAPNQLTFVNFSWQKPYTHALH